MSERKLVRDGYTSMRPRNGTHFEEAPPEAVEDLLADKTIEEINEFEDALETGDKEKITEEAGDVLETIFARTALHGITPEEVEKQRIEKRKNLGGFEKGIILVKQD